MAAEGCDVGAGPHGADGQRCCHHQLAVLGRPPYRVFSQTAIASELRHGLQSPLSRKTRLCTAILAPKRPPPLPRLVAVSASCPTIRAHIEA